MAPARSRKRRPYHHGDLRRALLDATLALATERGAAGVTLREVARIAGVSQTAPYRHFPDKQAMLAAAAEEGFQLFGKEMERTLHAAGPAPEDEIGSLCEAYVCFALDRTSHFRLMFGHGSPEKSASPGLQQAAREAFERFLETVERCLARAPSARTPEDVVFRLWALAHGIATLALERQALFDGSRGALARATRDATTDLFASLVSSDRSHGRR
jgi:AcrR family transcriptional regulator